MTIYDYAEKILRNLKMTSDNVSMEECYSLCASKRNIEGLKAREPQVIWGRRGTGKTTLQKAFVYRINMLENDPHTMAFYVMMARMIPTEEEIRHITSDGSSSLAVYIFSKLITELCEQLSRAFDMRVHMLSEEQCNAFIDAYINVTEHIRLYQTRAQGGDLNIGNELIEEINNSTNKNGGMEATSLLGIFSGGIELSKKNINTKNKKNSISISGKIVFQLETQKISDYIIKMLKSMNVSLAYICLDEYSEIDKLSRYSIQGQVGQLIKQVFLKEKMFSVKIATIWNKSRLHIRGGNRIEGIEYQQDIFAGPDLDIMFMENNIDVIEYFKKIIVNTYILSEDIDNSMQQELADYFEVNLFGKTGFRHIICGSQGISRSFVILAKEYITRFINSRDGILKLGNIYEIIRHQYFEDIRNKIPYFSIYKSINKFIEEKCYRYFLINNDDYVRCKRIIKYLAARGLYIQMPGHLTPRQIRDEYKLFIINYGNYLDALESNSYKIGRKTLEEDSKLEANGMLYPDYDNVLMTSPELYTVRLPAGSEREVYCAKCGNMFEYTSNMINIQCPVCMNTIQLFDDFIDEVSI